MKVRDIIKLLEEDGWFAVRTCGSHRHYKHPQKSGLVTVASPPSVDVPRGTLNRLGASIVTLDRRIFGFRGGSGLSSPEEFFY